MISKLFQIVLLALPMLAATAACETLPRMEGETLPGKPDAARGKIALLAMGFGRRVCPFARSGETVGCKINARLHSWACCSQIPQG